MTENKFAQMWLKLSKSGRRVAPYFYHESACATTEKDPPPHERKETALKWRRGQSDRGGQQKRRVEPRQEGEEMRSPDVPC